MRDATAWSYELLREEEQVLTCTLGIFAGSFTLGAAQKVTGDDDNKEVVADVSALVAASLVT